MGDRGQHLSEIDRAIVDLIERRAELLSIGAEGASDSDPSSLVNPEGRVTARGVRRIFNEILRAMPRVGQVPRVAFLGPPGTFSHAAALKAFGSRACYVEAATISGVFDLVERGQADQAVLPIESATGGGVTFTLDGLLEATLTICRELHLEVIHCLVGQQKELSKIERVYSHPQPLDQCRTWLARNLPRARLMVTHSTVLAAQQASEDEASAAICSELAAELNEIPVLRQGIQDSHKNVTRFIIVGGEPRQPTGADKTSLLFSTPHERGALSRVLRVFDEEGINLTRIESRPSQQEMWEYVFYVDLEGHCQDPHVQRALERIEAQCRTTRVLGSYPRGESSP